MDSKTWQKLFQGIRPDDQDSVVISMVGGLEIATQNIARAEEDLVMIRGRVAGEAEYGRLFLLPYEKIAGVCVNRVVNLEEVELFSPTVSQERKEKVAAMVAEHAARARQDAAQAEKVARGEPSGPANLREQLERLREQAGFGGPSPEARGISPSTAANVHGNGTTASAPTAPPLPMPASRAPAGAATVPAPADPSQLRTAVTVGPPTLPPRLSPKPPTR